MAPTKRERVLICIPAHDCKVSIPTCQSLVHSIALLSRTHAVNLQFCPGNAMIARARNILVQHARKGGYDMLFFIDNDLGWSPEAMLRLCNLPEELVAGIYPYRTDEQNAEGKWPVKWSVVENEPLVANENGLLEAQALPTGFMRIRMPLIQRMIDENPDKLTYDPQSPEGYSYALFNHEVVNNAFVGEDYYFCNLAKRSGARCWVDPNITFEHMGSKSWRGNLASTLVAMGETEVAA